MSFQPPTPPGQPPQQPPSWGGPPAGGPPVTGLSAGGPPPGAASGGRAHKPRMLAPGMIIAALVLIAVAVGVVLLVGGDDGGGGLDGDAAAEGFDALIDDTDFADGFAELRRCPLGDTDDLNERVAGTLDLADDVVDGESFTYASDRADTNPEAVWCIVTADLADTEADSIAYTASALPRGSYERFLEDSVQGGSVEVDDPQDHRGGTIYPYCFEPDEGAGAPGCGADWVDEDAGITIGLNYVTNGDADPAVDALKDVLPDLAQALADQD